MTDPIALPNPFDCLRDQPGGAIEIARNLEWSATSLGAATTWSASLRTLVTTVLENGFPMGIGWGADLALVYNDAFIPVLGAGKHPAAMGMPLRDVYPEAWEVIGPLFDSALAGKGVVFTDLLVPIAIDGVVSDHYFTFSYAPVRDESGLVAGVLITFNETTARILAEKQSREAVREAELAREDLHDFFRQAPLPMCILSGPEHIVSLVNPSYERLVGRDVRGKALREAFTEAEIGFYLPIVDRVYRTGEPVTVRQSLLELAEPDGTIDRRYIDVGYHPYRDTRGLPKGVLVIIHDVTEPVAARRAAEDANRLKDEFLATLSHELRTPLNAILGWASSLRLGAVREDRRERALLAIERNAKNQIAIVEDMLDVSRITSGKLRLELESTPMTAVVEAALETVRPAADAKGIRFEVHAAANGTAARADASRLQQVVWNLLSNAVKFTPRDGKVSVTLAREHAQVVLTVADSGQGIAPEFLPHVFERFRQGDAATTRIHGGLGLGLAIARHLMELHGGSIEAASEGAGRGAIFTVRIPAADANAE